MCISSHLCVTADAAHEPPERDDLLHADDILEVLRGAVQGHLLDGLGGLAGVLHWDDQVKFKRRPVVESPDPTRGLRGLSDQETRLTRGCNEVCGV